MATIDLHSHSTCSDGTDSITQLVEKAAAGGLHVLGVTDHDTTAGWDEAFEAGARYGVKIVAGLELSVRDGDTGAHLLAYHPDPDDPALVDMLTFINAGRDSRIPAMVDALCALGVPITLAQVQAQSFGSVMGRPHLADALVAAGVCVDRDEAFSRFLHRGGPAHVRRPVPSIEEAVKVVRAAGGVAVIAHPGSRGGHLDEARFAELADAGLSGIEVDHQEHDELTRTRLRAIATNLGLVVTGSSDHHGTGKIAHELACNTTAHDQLDTLLGLVRPANL